MPDEPIRQEVVSAAAVRAAYVLGSVGMVLLIIAILVLATTRPQGRYRALDTSQHQELLQDAEASLAGFEVTEDGAARLDIDHAMTLVAERGVDLPLVAGGVREPAPVDEAVGDPVAEAPAALEGAPIYGAQCAACHQVNGTGIPGAFPPLAGHTAELYEADRDYLPTVLLYGLQGPIEVQGQTYNGLMPPFPQLADDEIAAVVNHILTVWGDADALGDAYEPYAADDVEALRGEGLTGADVHTYRQEIGLP